jgi:hypothetical protein
MRSDNILPNQNLNPMGELHLIELECNSNSNQCIWIQFNSSCIAMSFNIFI